MTRDERRLLNSHTAMLKFIEALIVNSDKFGSRSKGAQRYYNTAQKLAAKARDASSRVILHNRGSEA